MKLCNIKVNGEKHLAKIVDEIVYDLGKESLNEIIKNNDFNKYENIPGTEVKNPEFLNIVDPIGKLICVGLNYPKHTKGIQMQIPEYPVLFSKFADALVPTNTSVKLYDYETSYDYEAELVIVIGKEGWDIKKEEAKDYVFGYTCGNDFSCRDAQLRSGQWLIGKTMPGFGPCGPCIVTSDEYFPENKRIQSYVNGELRQDGNTKEMLFKVEDIISYASRYIKLNPGDLIYTGTPSGVALEERKDQRKYLEKGDKIDIVIEGIGTLTNTME